MQYGSEIDKYAQISPGFEIYISQTHILNLFFYFVERKKSKLLLSNQVLTPNYIFNSYDCNDFEGRQMM